VFRRLGRGLPGGLVDTRGRRFGGRSIAFGNGSKNTRSTARTRGKLGLRSRRTFHRLLGLTGQGTVFRRLGRWAPSGLV